MSFMTMWGQMRSAHTEARLSELRSLAEDAIADLETSLTWTAKVNPITGSDIEALRQHRESATIMVEKLKRAL